MTKIEIVKDTATMCGVPQNIALQIVTAATTVITDALERGESVHINGLGTFEHQTRTIKGKRNPRTGESVPPTEKDCVKYIMSERLRERMNRHRMPE